MEFAIWHKDDSFTSTPEYQGTEEKITKYWDNNYAGGVSSLDHHIAPADPARRHEHWTVVDGRKLENVTPVEG